MIDGVDHEQPYFFFRRDSIRNLGLEPDSDSEELRRLMMLVRSTIIDYGYSIRSHARPAVLLVTDAMGDRY